MGNYPLNGMTALLALGQNQGIGSYLTSPYLSGMSSLGASLPGVGMTDVFQSGVRFGQALEKAAQKDPGSAKEIEEILKEAFGAQGGGKTSSAGNASAGAAVKGKTAGGPGWSESAAVYEPSGSAGRISGTLENYLAERRAARVQQRQSARQF